MMMSHRQPEVRDSVWNHWTKSHGRREYIPVLMILVATDDISCYFTFLTLDIMLNFTIPVQ